MQEESINHRVRLYPDGKYRWIYEVPMLKNPSIIIDVFKVMGISLGIAAWLAKGLEGSSALHIVNNMTVFYLTGFGFGAIGTQVGWRDFLLTFASYVVYILVLEKMSKKGMLR